jgi:hypothetical protein
MSSFWSGFRDYLGEELRNNQARKEAGDAVQARAAGKTREQVKELYLAELRARELKIPADDLLDAVVDSMMGDDRPLTRLFGRELATSAREITKLFKDLARHPR